MDFKKKSNETNSKNTVCKKTKKKEKKKKKDVYRKENVSAYLSSLCLHLKSKNYYCYFIFSF